jgi:hypothetical protein
MIQYHQTDANSIEITRRTGVNALSWFGKQFRVRPIQPTQHDQNRFSNFLPLSLLSRHASQPGKEPSSLCPT